ncbi:MAG: hypothetical protein ACFNLM_02190 [Selenomonas noxia]
MTINITLSEQDISQASKALTELIQACTEVARTNVPRNNNSAAPKAKAKPKAEPVSTPQPASAPKAEPVEEAPEATEPDETAVDYTELREALKAECAAIARDGKTKALKALLADYSVEKLSGLPDGKLEEFRAAAKAL